MPTYNLSETVHNIWLQNFGKSVGCCFVATSNDYVRAFKQSVTYRIYLNGGRCRNAPVRDELRLWQANQMANTITKYTSMFSFTTRIPHLEG